MPSALVGILAVRLLPSFGGVEGDDAGGENDGGDDGLGWWFCDGGDESRFVVDVMSW